MRLLYSPVRCHKNRASPLILTRVACRPCSLKVGDLRCGAGRYIAGSCLPHITRGTHIARHRRGQYQTAHICALWISGQPRQSHDIVACRIIGHGRSANCSVCWVRRSDRGSLRYGRRTIADDATKARALGTRACRSVIRRGGRIASSPTSSTAPAPATPACGQQTGRHDASQNQSFVHDFLGLLSCL